MATENSNESEIAKEISEILNDKYVPENIEEDEDGDEEDDDEEDGDEGADLKSDEDSNENASDNDIDPELAGDADYIEALVKKGEEEGLTDAEKKFLDPIMEKYGLKPTDIELEEEGEEVLSLPDEIIRKVSEIQGTDIETPEELNKVLSELIEDIEHTRQAEAMLGKAMATAPWLKPLIEKAVKTGKIEMGDFLEMAETSLEELMAAPDPGTPEHEQYIRNKIKKEQELVAKAERDNSYTQNLTKSEDALDSFVKAKKLNPDSTKKYFSELNRVITGIKSGAISESGLFDMVYNSVTLEDKVYSAAEKARIEARNEKIRALRKDLTSMKKSNKVGTKVNSAHSKKGDSIASELRSVFGFN